MANKKLNKLEFLKLAQAKLKEPPPVKEEPTKKKQAPSLPKQEYQEPTKHQLDAYNYLKGPTLADLERELDEKYAQNPVLERLKREYEDARREMAPISIRRRLEHEIQLLKDRQRMELPRKQLEAETDLWRILEERVVAVMPEVRFYDPRDLHIPETTEFKKYTLKFLADRLLSPRDRMGIVVVHKMAKLEGNEEEFLKELEKRLLKGAKERPESLK